MKRQLRALFSDVRALTVTTRKMLFFQIEEMAQHLPNKNITGTQVSSEWRKAMKLLDRIARHLKETHISATRFERRFVGDPRFVIELRAGRRPRSMTVEKVENYLDLRNLLH